MSTRAHSRFEMRLSDDLLTRLDEARGEEPRSAFVRNILEEALGVYSHSSLEPGYVKEVREETA